jgi:phosphatidylinositol alpha-1,6-mannosyltransferase
MILCPEFFDGRANGIGRVSGVFYDCLTDMGRSPLVWSANEPDARCREQGGRGFGRNYFKMMLAAAFGRTASPAPSVIACMHLGLSPAARLLAARAGAPYVVFLHGVEAVRKIRGRGRWGLAKAALLMANSRFTLSRFVQANPECAGLPAAVTPLGIGELKPAQGEGAQPNRRILIVSRMDKADDYKGHRVLIQALGLLADRFPDVALTVVGDGDDRADIEAYAASLPYAARIEFLGRVPDARLGQLYGQSAVFAMPSAGEGFGLVFLEAMAHGLPCVCGNRDASSEVVTDGLTGYCLPPDDPTAVAEGLGRLLADEGLRRRFGEAGRARYQAEFTTEHFKRRVRAALDRATGATGRSS